jgi:hypothetical protein
MADFLSNTGLKKAKNGAICTNGKYFAARLVYFRKRNEKKKGDSIYELQQFHNQIARGGSGGGEPREQQGSAGH